MPPLPADSIHARACKLKCEKILTRPKVEPGEIMEIFPGLCRWVKEKRPLSAHGIKTAFPDFLFCSVHAPHLALRVQRDLGINCHTKSLHDKFHQLCAKFSVV